LNARPSPFSTLWPGAKRSRAAGIALPLILAIGMVVIVAIVIAAVIVAMLQ
jgi:hypothetical protein